MTVSERKQFALDPAASIAAGAGPARRPIYRKESPVKKLAMLAASAVLAFVAVPAASANNQDTGGGGCYGSDCAVYGDGCIVAWSGEQSCA